KNGAFAVMYADMPIPPNETPQQIQMRLDGAREGMVRNANAKLTNASNITLDGKHPGREAQADLPVQNGVLRARIYVVGTRLYQVMATGTKSWADSPDVTKFLDSFALTE